MIMSAEEQGMFYCFRGITPESAQSLVARDILTMLPLFVPHALDG
jgi:hypothetical protein